MKAIFAGSFDPFTIGHKAIADRALEIFPELIIAIGYNEKKHYEWDIKTRHDAIEKLYKDDQRVKVMTYEGLTADFARNMKARFLVRGIRDVQDFEAERNLADINREIGNLETVILISEPQFSFISSSMVRELLHNGYDVRKYVAGDFPL